MSNGADKVQDGCLPMIAIEADTLPEAYHQTLLACWARGTRVETPKHIPGMALGYDAAIAVAVNFPLAEPRLHKAAILGYPEDLESYRLEVIFGIRDHWIGQGWDYTYHGRIGNQIDRVIERIKQTYAEKGRYSGRDFQAVLGNPDIDLQIDDPPCWQRFQIRLLRDQTREQETYRLNLLTTWRSRDLRNGWFMNVWAVTDWQRLLAVCLTEELGVPVEVGRYIDWCDSLHLYGLYFDKYGLGAELQRFASRPWAEYALQTSTLWEISPSAPDIQGIRRLIAAQIDYEQKTGSRKPSADTLRQAGYDLATFPYPPEWDR